MGCQCFRPAKRVIPFKLDIVFILDEKRQLIAFPDPDRMVKVKDGKMVPVQGGL